MVSSPSPETTPTIRGSRSLSGRCREAREEEGHLLSGTCAVYGDIRARYGELREDSDLVTFFGEVLERREELEEEERGQE